VPAFSQLCYGIRRELEDGAADYHPLDNLHVVIIRRHRSLGAGGQQPAVVRSAVDQHGPPDPRLRARRLRRREAARRGVRRLVRRARGGQHLVRHHGGLDAVVALAAAGDLISVRAADGAVVRRRLLAHLVDVEQVVDPCDDVGRQALQDPRVALEDRLPHVLNNNIARMFSSPPS
jgi:hypothetical protein